MKLEGDSRCCRDKNELVTSCVLVLQCGTAAMECVRQYITEVLDFTADMHTLTKLKVRQCSLLTASLHRSQGHLDATCNFVVP